MKKNILVTIIILLFTLSCATTNKQPKEYKPLTFDKSPSYKLDLSQIKKPDPINRLYGVQNKDGTITILPPEKVSESNVIVLDVNEYKKIGELVNLSVTYKTILTQQEVLINEKILIENSLKELVELESLKTGMYKDMYQESENMYTSERKEHKFDNGLNKIMEGIMMATIIAISL